VLPGSIGRPSRALWLRQLRHQPYVSALTVLRAQAVLAKKRGMNAGAVAMAVDRARKAGGQTLKKMAKCVLHRIARRCIAGRAALRDAVRSLAATRRGGVPVGRKAAKVGVLLKGKKGGAKRVGGTGGVARPQPQQGGSLKFAAGTLKVSIANSNGGGKARGCRAAVVRRKPLTRACSPRASSRSRRAAARARCRGATSGAARAAAGSSRRASRAVPRPTRAARSRAAQRKLRRAGASRSRLPVAAAAVASRLGAARAAAAVAAAAVAAASASPSAALASRRHAARVTQPFLHRDIASFASSERALRPICLV
jgi:hypothetical protein